MLVVLKTQDLPNYSLTGAWLLPTFLCPPSQLQLQLPPLLLAFSSLLFTSSHFISGLLDFFVTELLAYDYIPFALTSS